MNISRNSKNKNVLVIDNSKTSCFLYQEYFEYAEINLYIVSKPVLAIKYCELENINLIITEASFSRSADFEFIKILKSNSNCPVIVITTYYELKNQCMANGCDYFHLKPLLIEDLQYIIEKYLNVTFNNKENNKIR